MNTTPSTEPLRADRFRVLVDERVLAHVLRVSNLVVSGGGSGLVRYEPVVIERGRDGDDALERWALATLTGHARGDRRDVRVELLAADGGVALAWVLRGAHPVSYTAAEGLDAARDAVLLESVRLEVTAIERLPLG